LRTVFHQSPGLSADGQYLRGCGGQSIKTRVFASWRPESSERYGGTVDAIEVIEQGDEARA
jgi:hypothetical protein